MFKIPRTCSGLPSPHRRCGRCRNLPFRRPAKDGLRLTRRPTVNATAHVQRERPGLNRGATASPSRAACSCGPCQARSVHRLGGEVLGSLLGQQAGCFVHHLRGPLVGGRRIQHGTQLVGGLAFQLVPGCAANEVVDTPRSRRLRRRRAMRKNRSSIAPRVRGRTNRIAPREKTRISFPRIPPIRRGNRRVPS